MERDGCPTGYEKRGSANACFLKNRVKSIPFTINTKIGCDNFGGKWDDSYGFGGVCIVHDSMLPEIWIGWTAPIRGLYFYWIYEHQDPRDMFSKKDLAQMKADGENPEQYTNVGEVMGCIVKENPNYPNDPQPCTPAMIGGPEDSLDPLPSFEKYAEHYKGYALNMARGILEKAETTTSWVRDSYDYYDRGGRKLKKYHPEAIPIERDSGYGDTEAPSTTGRKPFRIHH